MGLTTIEILVIISICVDALVTIGLFLIVRCIINKIKGPRLSFFGFREKEIRSEYTETSTITADTKILKPNWFISIPHEILNIGDTATKFVFYATLELIDVIDKNTNKPMVAKSTNNSHSEVFEPGVWKEEYYSRSFGFVFDDVDAYNWEKAKLRIFGYYYNHNGEKKPIKFKPKVFTNPKYPQKLLVAEMNKIKRYNEQEKLILKK